MHSVIKQQMIVVIKHCETERGNSCQMSADNNDIMLLSLFHSIHENNQNNLKKNILWSSKTPEDANFGLTYKTVRYYCNHYEQIL